MMETLSDEINVKIEKEIEDVLKGKIRESVSISIDAGVAKILIDMAWILDKNIEEMVWEEMFFGGY